MSVREFILSDKKWYRLGRHVFFWLFWGGYFTMVRYFNPVVYLQTGHFRSLYITTIECIFFLIPQMVLIYPLLYFILPKYVFTHKYIKAIIWGIVFYMIANCFHVFFLILVPWDRIPWISTSKLFLATDSFYQKLQMAYLASLQGGLTGASLAGSFKMFKHYYLKTLRNQQLQQENTEAQLNLLMAQVHPHFMFNTLNNIYSQAQEESPKSAKMILELSHILRYILDEGRKKRVPLENELEMIVDYLNLEKIRYDQKLDLHYAFPKATKNITIAPLLLLPLVENCFKHGASKIIDNPWINIKAELKDNLFSIKLMNGKKAKLKSNNKRNSTGIENVQHRLNLIYPNKHILEIKDDAEIFIVDLQIELDYENSTETKTNEPSIIAYEPF